MIQVIDRTFQLLSAIGENGPCGLAELEERVGLNKGTTCNILRTLVELGYVSKTGRNRYHLGAKLRTLTAGATSQDVLVACGVESCRTLATELNEGVVGVLRNGDCFHRFVKIFCDEGGFVENTDWIRLKSVHSMATSKALLAFQPPADVADLLERHGESALLERLVPELNAIRAEGACVMTARNSRMAMTGVAVPVLDGDGTARMALGVFLPASRFEGKERDRIVNRLRGCTGSLDQ